MDFGAREITPSRVGFELDNAIAIRDCFIMAALSRIKSRRARYASTFSGLRSMHAVANSDRACHAPLDLIAFGPS